jgi:lysophospholipase L1-like esterase
VRSLFSILALLLGLAFSLVLGESLVRLLGLYPEITYVEKWRMRLSPNAEMVYEPIPNLSAVNHDMQYYLYPDKSNSLGFRGPDPAPPDGSSSPRIIVLGDSVVSGIWVEDPNQIFTSILQKLLRATLPSAEVVNFGVPGYNTKQEIALLKDRGLALHPDMVILAYCLNDSTEDNGGIVSQLEMESSGKWIPPSTPLLRKSKLALSVLYQIERYKTWSTNDPFPRETFGSGREMVGQYFAEFYKLSKIHRFAPVVVIFPDFDEMGKRGCRESVCAGEREAILDLARVNHLEAYDLCEAFEKWKRDYFGRSVAYDRYHLNPLGHTIAASALQQKITDLLLKDHRP